MKNNLFLLCMLLILSNCGGFELVYKTNLNTFFIKNNTKIAVSGDDASQIHVILRDTIGINKDNYPKYKLLVNSSKTEIAEVIKKDATASKFNIQYSITYDLYSLYKECIIYSKEINTMSSYNVKSAGYSFGSDISQKESMTQNIMNNAHKFISSLNALSEREDCNEYD